MNYMSTSRREVCLGDICSPKQHPTISGADLTDNGYPAFGANGQIGFYKTYTHDQTTIAITCRGATCGTVNIVPAFSYICGNAMALDNLDQKRVDLKFLAYLLRFRSLADVISGSAQPQITRAPLLGVRISLPPLPEQRRIAAILDQADALRAKRREALAKLDEMAQAIFVEMFGDPETNPRGWDETPVLGDVAEVASGITKGRKVNGEAVREIPYLAVSNVQDQHLNLTVVKTIEATEREIERYKLKKGDLVLTEGGDPDKLGRGVLWNDELGECIHQNHIFRIRLTSNRLHPLFLAWLVGSQRGKRYFFRAAKQTTGIASINMSQLRAFPLLVPPKDIQTSFVEAIRQVSLMKERLSTSSSGQESLFAALQHSAFSGTL